MNQTPRFDHGSVLLYSGGMDSEALRFLAKPDYCVHFRTGVGYSGPETQSEAFRACNPVTLDASFIKALERPSDRIVPLRNLFFVSMVAALGASRVLLGATKGDRVADKSEWFAASTSSLLPRLMSDYWNEDAHPVEVCLPMKGWTKRRIIQEYAAKGGDVEWLARSTFSCYNPVNGRECGACKPCFRKWVAFKLNGFTVPADSAPYIKQHILPLIQAGTYGRPEEEQEILEALER